MNTFFSNHKAGLSLLVVLGAASFFASPAKADTAVGSVSFTTGGVAISTYSGELSSVDGSFGDVDVSFVAADPTGSFMPSDSGLIEGTLSITPGAAATPGPDVYTRVITATSGAAFATTVDQQLGVIRALVSGGSLD